MKRNKDVEKSKKRAAKDAMFRAAQARGDVGGRSNYAQKVARKLGRGRIEPGWMWWNQRSDEAGHVTEHA